MPIRAWILLLALVAACGDDTSASDAGSTFDSGAISDAQGADSPSIDATMMDAPAPAPLTDIETTMPSADPIGGFAECTVTTARHVTGRAGHLAPCAELEYGISTPASGDHYSRWADFRRYEMPVPQGFLVHAMEHGAIVFQHGCADDCGTLFETIDTLIEEHGDDPACASNGVASRFIVVPNPELDEAAFAITAWENVYLGTCIDIESMRAFVETHYAQGPEDLCARGLDGEMRNWCE